MAEVERVSQQYLPLSTSCSAMYFTLESLNQWALNASSLGSESLDLKIITELETLKEEAAEVQRKMEETDTVMAEVERVS
uniref:Uncharacterized protein n=1 Tax=Amphimedon queenslandica TaxID=400682 RepID=A0A1X7U452_AMPQE